MAYESFGRQACYCIIHVAQADQVDIQEVVVQSSDQGVNVTLADKDEAVKGDGYQ